jgi:hypothetical protein
MLVLDPQKKNITLFAFISVVTPDSVHVRAAAYKFSFDEKDNGPIFPTITVRFIAILLTKVTDSRQQICCVTAVLLRESHDAVKSFFL